MDGANINTGHKFTLKVEACMLEWRRSGLGIGCVCVYDGTVVAHWTAGQQVERSCVYICMNGDLDHDSALIRIYRARDKLG